MDERKEEGVTGVSIELHNEIKSRMRWVGHVARKRAKGGAYKVLVGNPEGKNNTSTQMGGNVKIHLKQIGCEWIRLAQDRDR
jgi:hypothetical protein